MKTNIFLGFILLVVAVFASPSVVDAKDVAGARDYFLKGDKNSTVKVVTYTDFECPFCNKFHPTLERLIEKYKNEDVSFVYRSFPLDQMHLDAMPAAIGLECLNVVGDKSKNLEYSSIIFDNLHLDGKYNLDYDKIADSSRVDKRKFLTCVADDKVARMIESRKEIYAKTVAKRDKNFGTPYTVIMKGSKKITIPGAQCFEVVDKELSNFIGGSQNNAKTLSSSEKLDLVGKTFGKTSEIYRLVELLITMKVI